MILNILVLASINDKSSQPCAVEYRWAMLPEAFDNFND